MSLIDELRQARLDGAAARKAAHAAQQAAVEKIRQQAVVDAPAAIEQAKRAMLAAAGNGYSTCVWAPACHQDTEESRMYARFVVAHVHAALNGEPSVRASYQTRRFGGTRDSDGYDLTSLQVAWNP